jgi:hypothetical protein
METCLTTITENHITVDVVEFQPTEDSTISSYELRVRCGRWSMMTIMEEDITDFIRLLEKGRGFIDTEKERKEQELTAA